MRIAVAVIRMNYVNVVEYVRRKDTTIRPRNVAFDLTVKTELDRDACELLGQRRFSDYAKTKSIATSMYFDEDDRSTANERLQRYHDIVKKMADVQGVASW